jgi:SAM-dependent methyltransferase
VSLNKVCSIEDWDDPALIATMRRILPYFLPAHPDFPRHMEHRKHWEFAQVLNGLSSLGVLGSEAMVLSVAAGNEEVAFDLTNDVRWVFATDIYGNGPFAALEADLTILRDPDAVARCAYNRRRLVVQYMDALDLRFEDATFDVVYSLSSIEHFGGLAGASRALREQCRVTKPGGVVAFTTEVVVNGSAPFDEGHLMLSTPEQILELLDDVPALSLVEPIDFRVSDRTASQVTLLADALAGAGRGNVRYPHIILEHEGRRFTSVAVFLRRDH